MDLGKLNRDAEDRTVVWGAVAACVIAVVTLIGAGLAVGAGDRLSAAVFGAIGIVQLGLAYGVYRGSRACAVAVFALWTANLVLTAVVFGPAAVPSLWNVVFTVMLFAAMRATFVRHARGAPAAGGAAAR